MFVSPESSPGRNFYPRPPRGGRRRSSQRACRSRSDFYPRPPRGGRLCPVWPRRGEWSFLSTPSARRATDVKATAYNKALISIHALREEGDRRWPMQSLPLCGFLSTPSARRATWPYPLGLTNQQYFYPRPPRGGRPSIRERCSGCSDFYPRPPRGGRRTNRPLHSRRWYFYPRPPRGGRHLFSGL